MRFALKNQKTLYYALWHESQPIYKRDKFGHRIVVAVIGGTDYYEEIGQEEEFYSAPVEFKGTILEGGNNAFDTEFGIDRSEYDAVLCLAVSDYPIDEKSLIWLDSEAKTILGTDHADTSNVDFYVRKKSKGINTVRYALKRAVR